MPKTKWTFTAVQRRRNFLWFKLFALVVGILAGAFGLWSMNSLPMATRGADFQSVDTDISQGQADPSTAQIALTVADREKCGRESQAACARLEAALRKDRRQVLLNLCAAGDTELCQVVGKAWPQEHDAGGGGGGGGRERTDSGEWYVRRGFRARGGPGVYVAPPDPPTPAEALETAAAAQVRNLDVFVAWPGALPWGQQTRVRAILGSSDVARAFVEVRSDPAANVLMKSAKIARVVRAELTGTNVEIVKPEQTIRDVTELENVTFEWLVRPTRPGAGWLTLRLYNRLTTPGGTVEFERPAFEHRFKVKIGLLEWLTWYKEALAGLVFFVGLVLTAAGFGFANRSKIRRWWQRRRGRSPARVSSDPPKDGA